MSVILSVLWVVLKIVLWIFAVLVALVFIIVLLTAVPIKYNIVCCTGNKNYLLVKTSYFFKFIRVIYKYCNGKGKTDIYVTFFKVRGRKKRKEKIDCEEKEPIEKIISEKIAAVEKKTENKSQKKSSTKKESFIKRFTNFRAALTEMQVKTIIKHIFTAMKKILRGLRPKYFEISGVVGFSDPFKTGMILGAYEAVAGMFRLREKIRITGNFNAEKIDIRLKAELRGKVNIFRMTIPIIWLITRKPVFALIKKMWRKED